MKKSEKNCTMWGMNEENSIQIDSSRKSYNSGNSSNSEKAEWYAWCLHEICAWVQLFCLTHQSISLKNKAALISTAKNQSYNINWNDCKKSQQKIKNHKNLSLRRLLFISFYFCSSIVRLKVLYWTRKSRVRDRTRKLQHPTSTRVCLNSYSLGSCIHLWSE